MVTIGAIAAQAAATAAKGADRPKKPAPDTTDKVLGFFKAARDAAAAVRVDVSNQRKSRARQQIEDIKKRIADLMLVAMVSPKGAARTIAMLARQLGGAAKEFAAAGPEAQPAGDPMSEDAAIAAYQRSELHFADTRFAADIRQVHRQLKSLLDFDLKRAAAEAKTKGDDKDRDDIARQFGASSRDIDKAVESIEGWHQPQATPLPLSGAVDVKA
jgi:hypothetical protein